MKPVTAWSTCLRVAMVTILLSQVSRSNCDHWPVLTSSMYLVSWDFWPAHLAMISRWSVKAQEDILKQRRHYFDAAQLTVSPPNKFSSATFLFCFNIQSASIMLKVGENVWVSNSLGPGQTAIFSPSDPDPSCLHMEL